MKVVFKNGIIVSFDADGWDFNDVGVGNVLLMKGDECVVHLNWKEVLYVYDEEDK